VEIDWSSHGPQGRFDAMFWRTTAAPEGARPRCRLAGPYTNDPLRAVFTRTVVPRLRGHLKDRLPEYMIPTAWVVLDEMPLTRNGKIDRNALPDPENSRRTTGDTFVPPETPVEQVLAHIWGDVLGIDSVGAHDHFFDLGGHSLLVTQMIARVRDMLQVDVPFRTVFTAPTVRGLAAAIVDAGVDSATARRTADLLIAVSGMSDEQIEHMMNAPGTW
jgi:acyl carrier protein